MRNETKQLLELLFNPGEEIYATPDKFASVKNDDGTWKLYRPSIKQENIDDINTRFLTINPLSGDTRNDRNVTAFRSFLFEMDNIPVLDQRKFVRDLNIPFSVCVFSGGKSLHYVLTLDEDIPNIAVYRFYYEWFLKTIPHADQTTKNPSRGMRFPGVIRPDTGKKQTLVEIRERVPIAKFIDYLNRFDGMQPKIQEQIPREHIPFEDAEMMADWCKVGLANGFEFNNGRNIGWFSVGYEFAKCGYDIDTTLGILESRYNEESDFRKEEWLQAVKKGHRQAREKLGYT